MSYKCKCLTCGEEFATNKSTKNWSFVVCPNPDCRSNLIEFSDYSHSRDMGLLKV